MRTILVIALAAILFSCSKEGEIENQSMRPIKINGKEYRWLKVVPADGARAVWLLVPNDAKVELPQVIAWTYTTHSNKTTHYHSIQTIFVKA